MDKTKKTTGGLSREYKETRTDTLINLDDVDINHHGGKLTDGKPTDGEVEEGTVLVNPDANSMDSRG